MRSRTLTRSDIAESIQRQVGLSKSESSDFIEVIVEEMSAALAAGESVKISSFGSFVLSQKAERMGRNPKTGIEAKIQARKVLTFKASQSLKDQIAEAS